MKNWPREAPWQIWPVDLDPLDIPTSRKIGRTIIHSRNISSQIDDKMPNTSPPKKTMSKQITQKSSSSVPRKVISSKPVTSVHQIETFRILRALRQSQDLLKTFLTTEIILVDFYSKVQELSKESIGKSLKELQASLNSF